MLFQKLTAISGKIIALVKQAVEMSGKGAAFDQLGILGEHREQAPRV